MKLDPLAAAIVATFLFLGGFVGVSCKFSSRDNSISIPVPEADDTAEPLALRALAPTPEADGGPLVLPVTGDASRAVSARTDPPHKLFDGAHSVLEVVTFDASGRVTSARRVLSLTFLDGERETVLELWPTGTFAGPAQVTIGSATVGLRLGSMSK